MKKFDLTTTDGIKVVEGFLVVTNPLAYLVEQGIKYLFQSKDVEAQSKIAESLIKKGKEDGVDEMEIILENQRGGFKLSAPIEGVNIEVGLSAPKDKTIVKVKYK